MLRIVLGVLSGVVLSFCVIMAFEIVGQQIFPMPTGLDPMDPAAMAAHVAGMSPAAYGYVLLGWVVGAGVGGWLGALVSRRRWAGIAVGAVVAAGAIANALMLPGQPAWVLVAGVVLPPLAGWLASRFVGGPPAAPAV